MRLSEAIPIAAVPLLAPYFHLDDLKWELRGPRATKLGDYRAPREPGDKHRITLNRNMPKELFLITAIHELAHYYTHKEFGRTAAPHGNEWKQTYRKLAAPFLKPDIFSEPVLRAFAKHLKNPKASTSGDLNLWRLLQLPQPHEGLHLEQLQVGQAFELPNGLLLIKGEKRRTRYRCPQLLGKKVYLVHALATVKPVERKL